MASKYGPECERTEHTRWQRFRCEVAMYWFEYRSGFGFRLIFDEIYGRLTKRYFGGSTHERIFLTDKEVNSEPIQRD